MTAADAKRYFKPYPAARLVISTNGTWWNGYDGNDCVEVVFIPPNQGHGGNRLKHGSWDEFRRQLSGENFVQYFGVAGEKINLLSGRKEELVALRFPGQIIAVNPGSDIADALSDVDAWMTAKAQNLLRKRYQKPLVPENRPWIVDLLKAKSINLPMLDRLRWSCDYLVADTHDGWVVFDGKLQARRDVLLPLAKRFDAELIEAEYQELPQD
jgi:hypothetical protein